MGMLWGVTFSSGVPKQLAPNDGTDSQFLPLEELPVPPWKLPDAILRAWQPNLTVQVLDPPGSGIQTADDPPKKQSFGALETIQRSWQKTWSAQTYANNAAWNLPGLPRALPQPRANWPWPNTWGAQGAIDSTAWDPGTTPPLPKLPQPTWPREFWPAQSATGIAATYLDAVPPQPPNPVVWRNPVWSAQRAIASNAWDVVATQPPFQPQPPTILAAWQTSYRVTLLGALGGGSIAADNPPPFTQPRVDALWKITWAAQGSPIGAWNTTAQQVDNPPRMALPLPDGKAWQQRWSAQSAPPNAGWNFTAAAVDNPPLAKPYPDQVFRAWQPNVRVTLLAPTGGPDLTPADNPPAKQDYGQQRIAAMWAQTWSAQSYADNAGWNFVAATPDNPPRASGYPAQVLRAWQPEVRVTLLKPTGGDSVVTPDNPPFGRRQPDASGAWYATWKSLDVQMPSGQTQTPDDPPPYQSYGVATTLLKWQQTWSAQTGTRSAHWNFPPPDNPPVRQDFAKQQIVASWQMRWPAQGPGQTAAWNFVPPVIDNPPVRNQYSAAPIIARQWQQNWLAQSRSPIGWIFPEPVVPPPAPPDTGSRSGSGGGEPVKKKKPAPTPIQRRAGAKNTFVSLDSGQVYDKAQRVAKRAPAQIVSEADAIEEQEAAEILDLLEKLFK